MRESEEEQSNNAGTDLQPSQIRFCKESAISNDDGNDDDGNGDDYHQLSALAGLQVREMMRRFYVLIMAFFWVNLDFIKSWI